MERERSKVYRQLDNKMRIAGMEACDLIFILLAAAILNLFFGGTRLASWAVFVIPTVLGVVIHAGKRGRPEGHLIHLIRHHITPGYHSAGGKGLFEDKRRQKIYDRCFE